MNPGNDSTRTHHVLFAAFAKRFARAQGARGGGQGAPTSVAETSTLGRDAIVARAGSGALCAQTSWWDRGGTATGFLLWVGAAGALLGEGRRSVAELTEGDVQTLDQRLRLCIEGGGEGDLGFQWSALRRLAASEIDDALRGAGVPDESEVCEISLALGGGDVSFLFMATQLPSAEAAEAPAPAPVSVALPPGNLPHLLKVRMPLTIRLGSTRMSLDDVLRLTQGSLVELDQREDEPLDVLANGRVVARGEVVVVDERFGLRITEIGTTEDRARTAG